MLNNAAIISIALLWGDGDYRRTLGLSVSAGRDTDSNAATVGSAVRGFDRINIDELTTRTLAVRRALPQS